jgi:hypothetical protein
MLVGEIVIMGKLRSAIGAIAIAAALILVGCGGDSGYTPDGGGNNNDPDIDPGGGITEQQKISEHGTSESHTDERAGQNCMNCHYQGNNPYVYQVAGTVYQLDNLSIPYPNATIYFYTGPIGTGVLVGSMEVDANGNFFTTEAVDFSLGVYPAIVNTQGELPIYMSNFITHGECNTCHGTRTSPIYAGEQLVEPDIRVSEHGAADSHTDERRGDNCIACHTGDVVAGTVYDLGLENIAADGTIYLYNGANGAGDLVGTIEVDGNGNFFTNQPVEFGEGLYPVIESAGGERKYMPSSTLSGACNSCHGVSVLPVYTGEKINEKISQHGTTNSHTDERRGQDCMSCHYEGNNQYVYTVAGTVYQQDNPDNYYPNSTLYFYTQPEAKGELVLTLEVDKNGNFYTTEAVDLSGGLYPTVVGNANNDPLHMPIGTINGGCNICHNGVVASRIFAPGTGEEITQRVSAHGTTFSHTDGRRGANCLGCHNIGGTNLFQYFVAGSVYEFDLVTNFPDATISLYSGANGTGDLIATLEVDGNGNFYTTEPIDLGNGRGNGVYPAIYGNRDDSATHYMNESTNDGACSSSGCHSVNRPPIYAQ